jgi:CBS domain containing-hemolysin-like protein
LEETLNETFQKEEQDYDTVGGLVFYTLGRVPVKGEVLHIHPNYKCEIIAADPRRIRRVRITRHA